VCPAGVAIRTPEGSPGASLISVLGVSFLRIREVNGRADDEAMAELATRLFDMARRGDTASLETYLAAGVPVNLCNDSGDTLLMLAAYHGHAGTVAALLDRGADADRTNDRGQSPLAGAVFKGEDAVVHALLAAGSRSARRHAVRARHRPDVRARGLREAVLIRSARPGDEHRTAADPA
jgi:ankyrin repeat protein